MLVVASRSTMLAPNGVALFRPLGSPANHRASWSATWPTGAHGLLVARRRRHGGGGGGQSPLAEPRGSGPCPRVHPRPGAPNGSGPAIATPC